MILNSGFEVYCLQVLPVQWLMASSFTFWSFVPSHLNILHWSYLFPAGTSYLICRTGGLNVVRRRLVQLKKEPKPFIQLSEHIACHLCATFPHCPEPGSSRFTPCPCQPQDLALGGRGFTARGFSSECVGSGVHQMFVLHLLLSLNTIYILIDALTGFRRAVPIPLETISKSPPWKMVSSTITAEVRQVLVRTNRKGIHASLFLANPVFCSLKSEINPKRSGHFHA